ncbi:11936_t:CDS:10 [Diversispora eburnea]|uniref:11936_t:CDS:1 n=1 Tax=Diversispora eburnea TaxID=1213867 RepID=A0A9N8V788_9GLOM|nr:11936_t:CDS:10 [Diversispora eburnea]
MAVDGVAPRAKMNQQRGRRFRTAKDAAEAVRRAKQKGEELPKEAPFDSNCITPGTEFMTKLSHQLKYFINKKVTEDSNWGNVKIVLSGHEVPGEGEHKIMEYIRSAKAQSDYDPNVRHCLYGLDADLIMLGLLSHDPHFALLREEVTFGPSKKKKHGRIESQNFYLMHLSLLREYLDLEFSTLRESLTFEYNLERIIDDFILLALFVGNDFIPHLPSLHIAEGALGLMFRVYKKTLQQAGGYINNGGLLDMKRLEMIFKELGDFERDIFTSESDDQKWFKGKQKSHLEQIEKNKNNKKLVLSPRQKDIFEKIKELVKSRSDEPEHFPSDYPARDRVFIQNLAKELHIQQLVECDEGTEDKHLYVQYDSEGESDDDMIATREKVFRKYEKADVIEDDDAEAFEEKERQKNELKFIECKKDYYKKKMNIDYDNPEQIDKLIGSYVEGLQWVLHYYYNGVASWGWFYPYHYSPKITDLQGLERFDIKFELGKPFKPFEQLMGVLPEGSKHLLPLPHQVLMTDPNSPIIDFYPTEFDLDMNGKKQDWEAVVNIPFIDQDRLIAALDSNEHLLTEEEKERNKIGKSLQFTYDPDLEENHTYSSSLPGFFSDVQHCHCRMKEFHLPTLNGLKLLKGLCDGVKLGIEAMAGFPSLETIPHTGALQQHGVNVFNSESKNETMVITLKNQFENKKIEDIAKEIIGKRIFVGWPFLQEAKVQAISNDRCRYELPSYSDGIKHVTKTVHRSENLESWRKKAEKLEHVYSKRFGTITGTVEVVAHVLMLKGLKRLGNGELVKEYANVGEEVDYAIQTTVSSIESEDPRFEEKPPIPIEEEFPIRTPIFFLSSPLYGSPGHIYQNSEKKLAVKIGYNISKEPDFGLLIAQEFANRVKYYPSYYVAKELDMTGLTLSKLTASLHVICKSTDQRVNLGLNLKFEAKKQKVLGYTRKTKDFGWEYSEKAMEILAQYMEKFPEFIRALESKHKDEIYSAEDFYPKAEKAEAVERIRAIKDWLKTVEVRDFEKVSLDAEQLDKEAIAKVEKAADEYNKKQIYCKLVVDKVPRHVLLKPEHALTRLQGQNFNLGDRVVFVQDSGRVPIGAKGTVVGIEKSNIDVLFDVSFMSGSTLGDRSNRPRGGSGGMNGYANVGSLRPRSYIGGSIYPPQNNFRGGRGGSAGFLHRGSSRGGHFGNGISSRGRGRDDGKT